jgi:adrenodoxin-NADP+ reductase
MLEKYDVPASVMEVLHRSAVRHVSIIGRRGPLQAAFTTKELRELTTLTGACMIPLSPELFVPPPADTKLSRQQSRLLQLLQQSSTKTQAPAPAAGTKSWSLEFFRSPTSLGPGEDGDRLAVSLAHTTLDECSRAVPTGTTSVLDTDLIVTALGHRADPSTAYYDAALGHLRTDRGRVLDGAGRALRRVYASGWAATGARGVLAATMMDAYAVAETILGDYHNDRCGAVAPLEGETYSDDTLVDDDVDLESVPKEVEEGVKGRRVVQYDQWKKIDAEEMRRGATTGKERERMGWEEAYEFLTSTGSWHS